MVRLLRYKTLAVPPSRGARRATSAECFFFSRPFSVFEGHAPWNVGILTLVFAAVIAPALTASVRLEALLARPWDPGHRVATALLYFSVTVLLAVFFGVQPPYLSFSRMSFVKSDWEKLLQMGTAATAEMATDARAARMTKWTAIVRFVIEYCGLARAFSALEFLNEKHEIWCNQIIALTPGIVIRTNFEKEYTDLVGAHLEVEDWLRQMMACVKERSEMLTRGSCVTRW